MVITFALELLVGSQLYSARRPAETMTHGLHQRIPMIGYPEGHLDNPSRDDDIQRLKHKIECGADYIITQMFYDVDIFLKWLKDCRAAGMQSSGTLF